MNSVAYKRERKQRENRGCEPGWICAAREAPGPLSQPPKRESCDAHTSAGLMSHTQMSAALLSAVDEAGRACMCVCAEAG